MLNGTFRYWLTLVLCGAFCPVTAESVLGQPCWDVTGVGEDFAEQLVLAFKPDGEPSIAYEGAAGILVVERVLGAWGTPVQIVTGYAEWFMAISPQNGNIAIVYAVTEGPGRTLYLRERVGETWGAPLQVSTGPYVGMPSVAYARNSNKLGVAWLMSATGRDKVACRLRINGVWDSGSVIWDGGGAFFYVVARPWLVFAPGDDTPSSAYIVNSLAGNGTVRYGRPSGTTWSGWNVAPGVFADDLSLAYDFLTDQPGIAYHVTAAPHGVYCTLHSGSQWGVWPAAELVSSPSQRPWLAFGEQSGIPILASIPGPQISRRIGASWYHETLVGAISEASFLSLAVVPGTDRPALAANGGEWPAEFSYAVSLACGDLNCDGAVNAADIPHFIQALIDPAGYDADHDGSPYPICQRVRADMNDNTLVDGLDIQSFVDALVGTP